MTEKRIKIGVAPVATWLPLPPLLLHPHKPFQDIAPPAPPKHTDAVPRAPLPDSTQGSISTSYS